MSVYDIPPDPEVTSLEERVAALEAIVAELMQPEAFAVRVMDAINAMDVHASVDGGGYVRAHAKFKGNGQWWPSDEARKAQEKP